MARSRTMCGNSGSRPSASLRAETGIHRPPVPGPGASRPPARSAALKPSPVVVAGAKECSCACAGKRASPQHRVQPIPPVASTTPRVANNSPALPDREDCTNDAPFLNNEVDQPRTEHDPHRPGPQAAEQPSPTRALPMTSRVPRRWESRSLACRARRRSTCRAFVQLADGRTSAGMSALATIIPPSTINSGPCRAGYVRNPCRADARRRGSAFRASSPNAAPGRLLR